MDIWIPLLSALLGAVVGSLSTIAATVTQTRGEMRRERARLAVEAAIAERRQMLEETRGDDRHPKVYPLSSWVLYHYRVLEVLDRGAISSETLAEIDREVGHVLRGAEQPAEPSGDTG